MIFQGPKGYLAQIKYTCSMETVQKNGRFTPFLVNSTLTYILFSLTLNLNFVFPIPQFYGFHCVLHFMKAELQNTF